MENSRKSIIIFGGLLNGFKIMINELYENFDNTQK